MAFGLSAEKEEPTLKWIAGAAVIILTLGLGALNTWGAWIGSGGNLFFSATVFGAELLLLAALGLTILARTWPRRIAGGIITFLLMLACLSNGEKAIHESFKTVFIDEPEVLEKRATLSDEQAVRLEEAAKAYREELREDRKMIRQDIVRAEAELALMVSQTQISEAQTLLKAKGFYLGPIDGKRMELTESAMLKYGEELRISISAMKAEDTKMAEILAQGSVVPEANQLREDAVKMRGDAANIRVQTWWARLVLLAFEAARSFAVWAFLMVTTATAINLIRNAEDALRMAHANKRVMEINAQIAAIQGVTPATVQHVAIAAPVAAPPVEVQSPPPPAPAAPPELEPLVLVEPEPVVAAELPPVNQGARKGGKNASLMKAAAKAARNRVLILADRSDAQVMKVAAE